MVATGLFRNRDLGFCQWRALLCGGIIQTRQPNRVLRLSQVQHFPFIESTSSFDQFSFAQDPYGRIAAGRIAGPVGMAPLVERNYNPDD